MKYTLTADLPQPISAPNPKSVVFSRLKSISDTPRSVLSPFSVLEIGVLALFQNRVPKWGSGPHNVVLRRIFLHVRDFLLSMNYYSVMIT